MHFRSRTYIFRVYGNKVDFSNCHVESVRIHGLGDSPDAKEARVVMACLSKREWLRDPLKPDPRPLPAW